VGHQFSRKRRQTENIERVEANQHVRPDQHSSTRIMSSRDNDSELYFFQHILDKLCPRQANFFVLILKMTQYLAGLAMEVHAYQIIYCTQHIKFQMYMLIEKLGRDVEDSHDLIRDEVYQEQIESRLKMIIDRHCDFIR
jgi:hypothetical protein